MAINSNQKGKRGEREWVKLCREQGYDCKRSQQYAGGTEESADVVGLPYIHQEVKYGYDMTIEEIRGFVCQAIGDNTLSGKNNIPIVAHKKTYGKWFVSMETTDFVSMCIEAIKGDAPILKSPTYEVTYITMPADDWFKIYREYEAGKAIEQKEGA